jgi:uncharacterized DUF497 family protein
MRFEWDEQKNRQNRRKHAVSFELAQEVFADPFCLTVSDLIADGEERFWTIGAIEDFIMLVVVHTVRDREGEEIIRIISARKATPRERVLYEEIER